MTTYVVTSDLLSRKRGETFTDDELPGVNIAALLDGGHLQEQKQTGQKATDNKEQA
jgi:hypothetical protein